MITLAPHRRTRKLGATFDTTGWAPFQLGTQWPAGMVQTCPGTALIIGPGGDVPDWQHCPATKAPTFSVVKSEAPQGWSLIVDPRSVVGNEYYQAQYDPRTDFYATGKALPADTSGYVLPGPANKLTDYIAPDYSISYAGSGPTITKTPPASSGSAAVTVNEDLTSGGRVAVNIPLTPGNSGEWSLDSAAKWAGSIPWWVWVLIAYGTYRVTSSKRSAGR